MVLLILLLALVAWAVVATVVEIRRDGYRRTPTDPRRVGARDSHTQPESWHVYR